MDNTKDVRNRLLAMEKSTSLLQISKRSNINYITLRNIKSGETKRVSASVLDRFNTFAASFVADASKATSAVKAAPAKKKPGPIAKAAVVQKAAQEAPAKKKPGPKPKETLSATPSAPGKTVSKKKGVTRGRKPGSVAKAAVVPATAPLILSDRLKAEIATTQKYLEYLLKLEKLESDFRSVK